MELFTKPSTCGTFYEIIMSDESIKDITIIGAGPSGLFTAFEAGMHEASVRIIDSLPESGGQLSALYPEKYIFDVPGFTRITAKELARNLFGQANQFSPELRLNETVVSIVDKISSEGPAQTLFEVSTDKGVYLSKAIIIAAGLGAFKPRSLGLPEVGRFEGNSVHYFIREKEYFKGKDVIIVGGGDSALDWVINLIDTARGVTLVHRKDTFRAHPNTIQQIAEYAKKGRINVITPFEVKEVYGDEVIKGIRIIDGTGKEADLRTDALLLMLGFTSDLGPIEKWGLDIDDSRIKVNLNMETNRKGVFAVGDIANYPGKLKLILTGFSDGARAVKSALPYIRPGDKVRHVHSTSLKIFSKTS